MREAEKQLSDKIVYQEVQFKKQMLSDLVDTSNQLFRGFKTKGFIAERNWNILRKNTKRLVIFWRCTYYLDVPGRPIISNCGMHTEKASESLDYDLKPVM